MYYEFARSPYVGARCACVELNPQIIPGSINELRPTLQCESWRELSNQPRHESLQKRQSAAERLSMVNLPIVSPLDLPCWGDLERLACRASPRLADEK